MLLTKDVEFNGGVGHDIQHVLGINNANYLELNMTRRLIFCSPRANDVSNVDLQICSGRLSVDRGEAHEH